MLLSLQVLYLFAPLLLASALSGLVLRFNLLSVLKRPIDGGASLGGRRIFGDSKTWRGVVVAILGCVIGVAVQKHLIGDRVGRIAVLDYRSISPILFGVALGAAAMVGELPNSFVKRRLAIAPGGTAKGPIRVLFYVWDQIDLLTTAWPVIWIWARPGWRLVAASFVLGLVVHQVVSLIGFLIGARRSAR
jgi:hypothetical protein